MVSIFKNDAVEKEYYLCYDRSLAMFEMDFMSLNIPTTFGETHILCFGDKNKKPLLLLHGMTMSSTMWYPNMKQLIQERCVYAIDIMGDFGKSKPLIAIKNRKDAGQWILEVVNALQFNKVDLAGHSMGGFLSLNFALAYPERLSKLMLYAPAGTFHKISLKFFTKIYPALLFHTEKWIDKAFRWFSGKGESLHPVFRSQVIAGYRYAKPLLQVMPSVFSREEFSSFQAPTLLLIGDKEVIYPARKAIANAQNMIPDLETHLIAGASHSLTMEHADIVNELTLRFLKKED
ncbi:Pimeloyl-ACP methyl ester carboxylesterase [Fontibacillus panacisegetis]|uniref:Pimeloyl-ACP methyl ester carboxylesterase n=1 Tax=Fontibacillus panacisegetis TaxID=670482 RepID=A0A1G7LAR0_9BACL|nr:alpha/beta hydrolase [Fontibacillus panacisegetis]SDF46404.1 Pimeloyl-ACP methyl ester carboxylesterase [Fontibacillus panacisegetis]